jgi:hypothetical protein
MYEVYIVHPILGEIFLSMVTNFQALSEIPDTIDGLTAMYRYVE